MTPALVAMALVAGACGSDAVGPGPATQPPASTQAPVAGSPAAGSSSTPEPAAGEEQELSAGAFERIGYDGEGEATVVETGDGVEIRFSEFRVEQGPALRVYLSAARAGAAEGAYDDDFIDLGALEAFRGDQTYAVPPDADIAAFRSVVIWCAEFDVGFVVAPIRAR